MKHLVMFSGGVGSWATGKRVVEQYGPQNVELIFADTRMEDEDLYRFLLEAAHNIGARLKVLADGRTPWEVFQDVKFVGNSRVDPCSRILKRDLIRGYLEKHFSPEETVIYLGIDWTEIHRLEKAKPHWEPWTIRAPMCEKPYLDKNEMLAWLSREGIEIPRLYKLGFPHNNCGGFCVKAGHAHFEHLLRTLPERYAWHEKQEEVLREQLGEVAVLRCRRKASRAQMPDGKAKPLPLSEFRLRVLDEEEQLDWGGCGCFSDF